MRETHLQMAEDDRAAQAAMGRRIDMLERGIRAWRCLAATGFVTALGAFGLAVFGLSQLENTYFIGEMTSAPAAQPLYLQEDPVVERAPASLLPSAKAVFPSIDAVHAGPTAVGFRVEIPQPHAVKAVQEMLAATEGGS